jgi:hypothetical protein
MVVGTRSVIAAILQAEEDEMRDKPYRHMRYGEAYHEAWRRSDLTQREVHAQSVR